MISKKINGLFGNTSNPVSHIEKLVSTMGGFTGVFLVMFISSYFISNKELPLIVASMGASAVLLFAVPHGALSQPWSLLGGHLVSTLIGITCATFMTNSLFAAPLAVALAIGAMHYLRCIHPPGGATALIAVIGGDSIHQLGYFFIITPVLLNVIILLIVAVIFNYFFSWRRYPASLVRAKTVTQPNRESQNVLLRKDLEYALKQINSVIDITEEDLDKIYRLAIQHAEARPIDTQHIELGRYYSNGQYGNHWSIRQITQIENEGENQRVHYKIIAGTQRRSKASCTLEDFIRWARYEVERDENSWRIINNSSLTVPIISDIHS